MAPELSNFQCGHIPVETIAYFLKRYREDMMARKQKSGAIEKQLADFEARLRRELMQERLAQADAAFAAGHLPKIHVDVAALQNSAR